MRFTGLLGLAALAVACGGNSFEGNGAPLALAGGAGTGGAAGYASAGQGSGAGSAGSVSGTGGGPAILLRIVSPADAATIYLSMLADGSTYTAAIETSGFSLLPAGQCSGQANCGHGRALVDGISCNAPGASYNSEGAGALTLHIDQCPTVLGMHRLSIDLRNDDDTEFIDSATLDIVAAKSSFTIAQ